MHRAHNMHANAACMQYTCDMHGAGNVRNYTIGYCVVVWRRYGGTKLGAVQLGAEYSKAAQEGVRQYMACLQGLPKHTTSEPEAVEPVANPDELAGLTVTPRTAIAGTVCVLRPRLLGICHS